MLPLLSIIILLLLYYTCQFLQLHQETVHTPLTLKYAARLPHKRKSVMKSSKQKQLKYCCSLTLHSTKCTSVDVMSQVCAIYSRSHFIQGPPAHCLFGVACYVVESISVYQHLEKINTVH